MPAARSDAEIRGRISSWGSGRRGVPRDGHRRGPPCAFGVLRRATFRGLYFRGNNRARSSYDDPKKEETARPHGGWRCGRLTLLRHEIGVAMRWDDGIEGVALAIAGCTVNPLRVVAGPGTGKTFALKRRVWLSS